MTRRLPRLWMVIPFTCLLLILLGPLGSPGQPSPQFSSGTETAVRNVNLLITAQGDVKLSRTTWVGYHPTTFGATLQRGDLLKLGPGSKARVLCADTTIWQIPSGLSSLVEGCPELREPVLKRGRELIIATRSMNIQQGPYVISPSNTKVLSAHQLSLQWQSVPDASMYRVRVVPISGSEKAVCEKVESTTKVVCEDIHLTPQPVYNYKVTVQVVNDHSSKGASEGLGFTPLRDDEVARVMADSRKLQALPIPMEARTLALAYLYIGYELRADAMHKLLEERTEGNTVPYSIAAHTLLGRLAREMRLPHEAERYYTQASQLAERTQSLESQASIQEGLGYVYKELKEATKAKAWFERAQASYRQLGDKQRLQEIAEQLGRLQ